MEPTGHTKPFAVLGHPIAHSLSPVMHNAAFRALGMDAVYLAFDVDPLRLMSVLQAMAEMGFGGANLTIPLKEVAFKNLSDLDDSARTLGAVNTVEFRSGGLRGHNTDGAGFMKAVEEAFETSVEGLSVFILGAGGAGRAVAITCATRGAGRVALADIIEERTRKVAREISDLGLQIEIREAAADPTAWRKAAHEAQLVVQATPVGMRKGDGSLLSRECFRKNQMVMDLVYMFPETAFMKAAREAGARTANGLGMLLHQGALAFTIWTGREPAVKAMRDALERAVYGNTG